MSILTINKATTWLMGVDPIATGKQLKRFRRQNHLSQENLSEIFEQAGDSASRNTISMWENGRKLPTLEHIVFLAELYHCTQDELVISYRRSQEAADRDQPVPLHLISKFKSRMCMHATFGFLVVRPAWAITWW